MFMFNLLFDPASLEGLFVDPKDPPDANPLKNSKHWLMSNRANPNFEDERDWLDLDAGTLHIPNAQRGLMAIRIAPTAAFANPVEAELLAAFGRPVIQSPKRQPFASPFRDGVRAKTTFYRPRAARPAGGITGWILDLGQLDRPGPGSLNKTHRYEFAVGINVFSGVNIICSYGEDPEFDVGG